MQQIIVKAFNGIGDLLFMTPSFRVIKETYGDDIRIRVNTKYPELLVRSPYVDEVGGNAEGLFVGYPDPIHRKDPITHHILSDWRIICDAFGLKTPEPRLSPEVHFMTEMRGFFAKNSKIGVQVVHKGFWNRKKVWPYFDELAGLDGFEPIPMIHTLVGLSRVIASYAAVVCAEGGISHLAKALGTPAVVVYGGFADPKWNGYKNHVNVINVKSCSPCYHPGPCEAETERQCLREISVDLVQKEAECIALKGPKLNLGSGDMILDNYINLDYNLQRRGSRCTNILADAQAMPFLLNTFSEVLFVHIIEHFHHGDAVRLLKTVYGILRRGGRAIAEGPDILGAYDYYITRLNNPAVYIQCLYGQGERRGSEWAHKWGWTKDILAKQMEDVGFKIVHKGIGWTHGMGSRDFRVEGIKE